MKALIPVTILKGFFVALCFCFHLFFKTLPLVNGVVQLREGVAVFSAHNKYFKAVEHEVDLGVEWERITMNDVVKRYTDIDFSAIATDEEARAAARAIG